MPRLRPLAVVVVLLTGLLGACGVSPPDDGPAPDATRSGTPTDRATRSGLDDVLDTLPRSAREHVRTPTPDEVLGPGTPVPDVTDLAEVAALRSRGGDDGAESTVLLLLSGWRTAATTGDRSVLDAVRRPGCAFCASVAASPSGGLMRPEDGYAVAMTAWPAATSPSGSAEDEHISSVVVHLLTTLEGTVDDVPHLHVVQDETLVLEVHLVRGSEGWGVEGVATRPWGEAA